MRTLRRLCRGARASAAMAAVIAVVATGCGADGPQPRTTSSPTTQPSAPTGSNAVRSKLHDALVAAGEQQRAALVAQSSTEVSAVDAPFLTDWSILQVDSRTGSRPVRFFAGLGGGTAVVLTGSPEAFNEVTAADRVEVGDPRTAVTLAVTYLRTTRSMRAFGTVIDAVDEIQFNPNASQAERDEVIERFGSIVEEPEARATGDGHVVTAYVVQGSELQRRRVQVTADGSVSQEVEVLTDDLPVPISS